MSDQAVSLRIVQSIAEIDRGQWNTCANSLSGDEGLSYDPFLSHDFLLALEESGSVSAETGWAPAHLALENASGETIGVAPVYLKGHSRGEYVFDHAWADAFERAGGSYYPKLQLSIPFTPVNGRRLLTKPGPGQLEREANLIAGIKVAAEKFGVSSAHVTFLPENQARHLESQGFLLRNDQQFHWSNKGYYQFEDFLQTLTSRKRKNLRKERAAALSADIDVEWITGSDITEDHWDHFFRFYLDTGSRKWGSPYLTRAFFSLIGETMSEQILLIMAKREGKYIAGALNFIGGSTLYGRNWGCIEDHRFLHFELCYYQAIDFAIARKLKNVEAGAQGGHKLVRGYEPTLTWSAHWIAHPGLRDAVRRFLDEERKLVEQDVEALTARTPFRKTQEDE